MDMLIQTAIKNGGKDNITAILVSADDNAPEKQPEYDTVPINTEEIKETNIFERLYAWLKRTFLSFLSTE